MHPTAPDPTSEVPYRPPSLDELLTLCSEFELATVIHNMDGTFRLRCKDEDFTLDAERAAILARGLLLGYFAFHTRDDLSLANWEE